MAIDIHGTSNRLFENGRAEFKFACDMICLKHEEKCDSPIELLFLGACEVFNICYDLGRKQPTFFITDKNAIEYDRDAASVIVIPQYNWNSYRIDFCIVSKLPSLLFIECDGHEFHERTKEQAERDRSRDRKIQEAGIPILRFTGRELHRDAMDCVLEVARFINARAPE